MILVLGDQLTDAVAALREGDPAHDVVVMAEVADEAGYVPHHPKKIAFCFSAMRHFAEELARPVGPWITQALKMACPVSEAALIAAAEKHGTTSVIATRPGEWRLIEALDDLPLDVTILEDDRFVASHAEFDAWAEGRKELRMEWFYRDMRRKTGLLMDGDKPVQGKWNFDHDNRKPAPGEVDFSGPMQFTPDAMTEEVLELVEARFGDNFGHVATLLVRGDTRGQARRALTHFIEGRFAEVRRLSGRHAGRESVPLALGPVDVPERGASGSAGDLRGGRGGVQGGQCADQRRRRLHPSDHRLARIHARHLFPRRPRLCPAERAEPPAQAAGFLLDREDGHALHREGRRSRRGTRPMRTTSSG